MIKLYCFGESGNAYKAALPLELSGLPWEAVKVDFFNGAARTPEFRAMNVMGEAPVLEDGDIRLTQSGVIQHYITEKSGKFGGDTTADAREVMRWQFWDNHKMSSVIGTQRYLMNFVPEDKRPAEVIHHYAGRLKGSLKVLETALDGRDWLVGGAPTHADFCCCGYLFYPEPFGFDRADWPNITRWLEGIQALDGWKHPYDLMPGSPADRA